MSAPAVGRARVLIRVPGRFAQLVFAWHQLRAQLASPRRIPRWERQMMAAIDVPRQPRQPSKKGHPQA